MDRSAQSGAFRERPRAQRWPRIELKRIWRPGRFGSPVGLALLFALMPLGFASVSAEDSEETVVSGEALIRVVQASPDAPALDLIADERVMASGLVFGDATGFLPVPDGEVTLRFVPAGGAPETAVVEVSFDFADGQAFEVVALGQLREIDARVFEIDRTKIEEPGKARLRVIHLAPDAGRVSFSVGGEEPLFDGVEFAEATPYEEVTAGSFPLTMRSADPAAGDQPGALAETELTVPAAGVYDLLAIGLLADGSLNLLTLAAMSELPCGELLGTGGHDNACVRIVQASPDAPAVDVYLDDLPASIAEGLEFGDSTGFMPVAPGEHAIAVVPVGKPRDETLRESSVDFAAGAAYDLAAVDLVAQLELTAIPLDLSPLPPQEARLRLIHAIPNQGGIVLTLGNGDALFSEVGFPDASPVRELPAGAVDLAARLAADPNEVLVQTAGVELEAGLSYQIYAIGQLEGGTARLLILSAPAATVTGAPSQETAT